MALGDEAVLRAVGAWRCFRHVRRGGAWGGDRAQGRDTRGAELVATLRGACAGMDAPF